LSDAYFLIFSDKSTASGCQHGYKSSVNQSMYVFVKLVLFTACQRQLCGCLCYIMSTDVSKVGGPFAYEKWGGPTFYSSKVGGHDPPLSMVATPLFEPSPLDEPGCPCRAYTVGNNIALCHHKIMMKLIIRN